jgi:hypothetical protein
MSEQCPICKKKREEDSEFCSIHKTAATNIENTYPAWSKGFGGLSKAEYYSRLEKNPNTGPVVKEVIRYLLLKP